MLQERCGELSRILSAVKGIGKKSICVLALLFGLVSTLQGEDLTGYTRRIWLAPREFPEQAAESFAQTPDGYLWVGTLEGLLRFDGAHFTLFDNQNTTQLKEPNVFCLTTAHDGTLWIGTEGGGLVRYQGGHFKAWSSRDGLSNDFVRVIHEEADGSLLVGTDNGLLRWNGREFERIDGSNRIPQMAVHAIFRDRTGALWVGGSQLVRVTGKTVDDFSLPGPASQNRVKSITQTSDGRIWVGTVSGLKVLNAGEKHFSPFPGISATVRILYPGSENQLWIGTIGQGLFRLNGGHMEHYTAPLTLPTNTILNIFEDSEKNLWIGTQTGLMRLTKSRVQIVSLPKASDSDYGTVYADNDGSFWIGSDKLFHLHGGQVNTQQYAGLNGVHVRNLLRGRDGVLWAGTDGAGLLRLDGKQMLRVSTHDGLTNDFVRAMAEDRQGALWAATDEGLNRVEIVKGVAVVHRYQMRDGLAYFSTRSLLVDRDGSIWVGTDRGVSHLSNGIFLQDAVTQTLAQTKIWAMHQDGAGVLWLATRNNGLFRWDGTRLAHFTTDNGLASNAIYQILGDNADHLWLSSPNGISLLNRRDLESAAKNGGGQLALTFISTAEMAPNIEIYGGTQPSGSLSNKGEIWIPTSLGPVHLFPQQAVSQLPPPPIMLESILRDGRAMELQSQLDLAPGTHRLGLTFAPIRLRTQDGLRFRYMMEGLDQNWSMPTSARTAEYTNLPAGHYRFRVQVFDTDSPQALSELSLEIEQRPFFYRTWWFLTLCALLIAAAIFGYYRYRMKQMKIRYEAVLEERSRLAREMHDTVIQGCTGVSALLEAASMSAGENTAASPLTDFARQQLRTTIDEAREAIWNLRNSDNQGKELKQKLEAMTLHVAEEFSVPVSFAATEEFLAIDAPMAHDLLMVAREAVTNSVLHGAPSSVQVELSCVEGELSLEIRDDGCGFVPEDVARTKVHHFGLKGMRERLERCGGSIEIVSHPGEGTRITARIANLR